MTLTQINGVDLLPNCIQKSEYRSYTPHHQPQNYITQSPLPDSYFSGEREHATYPIAL
ncbi:MAG: hypothetical protein ACK5MK_06355 [Dysgonomonas sp.]